MSNDLYKFMVEKNLKSFKALKRIIQDKKDDNTKNNTVDILINKMVHNMPPMQVKAKGPLENVTDFVSVQIGGKIYPFANKDCIIYEIVDDKTKERLYDASLVVNSTTQYTETIRFALGLPNPDSKQAYAAKKLFNSSLHQ